MIEVRQGFIDVIQDVLLLLYSHCDQVLRASVKFRSECKS
jgi:hypothetical protein